MPVVMTMAMLNQRAARRDASKQSSGDPFLRRPISKSAQ
jgi:hypothetical protein